MDILSEILNCYTVTQKDENRPWGKFYYVSPQHQFVQTYFPSFENNLIVSPKILYVNSNTKLSWQYHHRRNELWKILYGPVGIIRSDTDEEHDIEIFNVGDTIQIPAFQRHRLVGLDNDAIVAELWCHTDANHPSTEDDIVRVSDIYSRS